MRLRILLQPDDLLDDRQPAPPIVGRPVDARPAGVEQPPLPRLVEIDRVGRVQRALLRGDRSEEHTSELQSLMRISYAVFCLKKKINDMHKYDSMKHTAIRRQKDR